MNYKVITIIDEGQNRMMKWQAAGAGATKMVWLVLCRGDDSQLHHN